MNVELNCEVVTNRGTETSENRTSTDEASVDTHASEADVVEDGPHDLSDLGLARAAVEHCWQVFGLKWGPETKTWRHMEPHEKDFLKKDVANSPFQAEMGDALRLVQRHICSKKVSRPIFQTSYSRSQTDSKALPLCLDMIETPVWKANKWREACSGVGVPRRGRRSAPGVHRQRHVGGGVVYRN